MSILLHSVKATSNECDNDVLFLVEPIPSKQQYISRLIVGEKGKFVDEGFVEFLSLKQNGITCLERDNVIT
jgi:hypothetical protein